MSSSAKSKHLMTDLFHEILGNPTPERANAGYFAAHDSKQLRHELFPATSHLFKDTLILLPGRNECVKKYSRPFAISPYAVIPPLPSTGAARALPSGSLRDRYRGHVKSFNHYAKDLDAFFEKIVLLDCRASFFVLAYSSGALIALLAAPTMINRVQRMVLVTPFMSVVDAPLSIIGDPSLHNSDVLPQHRQAL